MSTQNQILEPSRGVHASMTAAVALLTGAVAAVVLAWLAQGTDAAGSGPVWHGNSGPIAAHTPL